MPIPISKHALDKLNSADSRFNLDISGVAGFFGGDVAVSAMGTIHLYRGRRWLGWYNSPGSYDIAKSYGVLCKSRIWDGLYPGVNVDPAVLFGLNHKTGPAYRGIHSGTAMARTGHIGYLLAEECKDLKHVRTADGRVSSAVTVTVVDLNAVPEKYDVHPVIADQFATYLALVPISTTLAASILSVIVAGDWYSFGLILFGALVSGSSCIIIGSAKLQLRRPEPAPTSPPGDGILGADSSNIIVLLGPEHATNIVTKGGFHLHFNGEPRYNMIGICALFLTIQFLAQLLIIPVGTLFGQLMFLASLAASWLYTAFLSSIDRESLQRAIVNAQVLRDPPKLKYNLGTRTMGAVFALLVLRDSFEGKPDAPDTSIALRRLLDELLPNDTRDWTLWKDIVVRSMVERTSIPSEIGRAHV